MKEDLKYINSTKNLSEKITSNEKADNESKIIEVSKESDPLFDLINHHKKRLLEIKKWQNNFNNSNNVTQSEIAVVENEKNNKNNNLINFINNIGKEESKEKITNIENNIKIVKDFLKVNSLNKSNMTTENNDESSININGNILNTNNDNNLNDISVSVLKESLNKDLDNKNNIIEEQKKYMSTKLNFKNKFKSENIKIKNNNSFSNTKRTINDYDNKGDDNRTKVLEFKLEKKKIKIKNLKSNIEILTKENNNLKKYINELEKRIEDIDINKENNFVNRENIIKREQDMLNKINLLSQEILEKNEQIEKMKYMDKIKIKDIQTLNQKCRELELISNEINKEKIEKLVEENKILKNKINNTDKVMFITNYFIKKIYNMIPCLQIKENFEGIKEPYELQKIFIEIENFINEFIIYDSNKKSSFYLEFEKNKTYNNQYFNNLDKEREKEELEAKINEINQQNINLLKEIQSKNNLKRIKKNNEDKSKVKKSKKINIKNKKNTK